MNKSRIKTRKIPIYDMNDVVCGTCSNGFYVDFTRCKYSTNEEQTQIYAEINCPYCKSENKVIM